MRTLLIAFLGITLTACDVPESPEYAVDQEKRTELFQQCLNKLPAGPVATHYNDWSEVVDSCSQNAYYSALVCVRNCERSSILPKSQ